MWWERAVVYQIYPRSFQDADGDGLGDLRGAARRLDYVASLGTQAVWLSPFYPSSDYDFGYDVDDFCAIDPRFGTFDDLDALLAEARRLGLRVLMDLVPCHTSIDHRWFRERPDFYVIRDTPEPPNNWRAAFGGSTWSRDPYGRGWYLHSFYPEQPDLDWRNPEVVAAMQDVVRFWLDRGVDGLRLDALDRLMKDPELRDDPPRHGPPPLPLHPEHATLDHVHSRNAPDIGTGLAALRAAAGDRLLVGEVYLPNAELGPYLRHLDLAFSFELYHARFHAEAIRAALASAADTPGVAWVLSNHDFRRLPNRVGPANVRLAALLLLTLPGCAFVYQGDELGVSDGPEGPLPRDRHGRDGFRLDALDRLMKDPELRDDPPRRGPPPLPLHPEHATLDHVHSRNAPDIATGLAALREAAGDRLLVGEVYLPNAELGPYLRHLDLAFSFELLHAPFAADAIRAALGSSADLRGVAWVLSNHDFKRLPDRVGPENVPMAALLLLTLPGCAFVYQGDELGVPDGPEGPLPLDRFGRDGFRNPLPWEPGGRGGFTTGKPWLPPGTAPGGSAAAQGGDPGSMLNLYRRLIALHGELPTSGLEFVDHSEPNVLAYRRGEHVVVLNLGDAPVPLRAGEIVVSTAHGPPTEPKTLSPHTGVDIRTG